MTTVVKLDSMRGVAQAVPMLLGFTPQDSVVAMALKDRRVSFSMRLDLDAAVQDVSAAAQIVYRLCVHQAEADEILLVLYTDQLESDERAPYDMPHRDLVDRIAAMVPVKEAMLVHNHKLFSYTCMDPKCCDPAGMPLDEPTPSSVLLAAEHAVQGTAVQSSRDVVVASLAGPEIDTVLGHVSTAAPLDPFEVAAADVEHLQYLSDGECAGIIVALHDTSIRDRLIAAAANGDVDAPTVLELLRIVLRRCGRHVASVAAAYAAIAYANGDGVRTRIALDRAIADDPEHALTRLLTTALDAAVPPQAIRAVLRDL